MLDSIIILCVSIVQLVLILQPLPQPRVPHVSVVLIRDQGKVPVLPLAQPVIMFRQAALVVVVTMERILVHQIPRHHVKHVQLALTLRGYLGHTVLVQVVRVERIHLQVPLHAQHVLLELILPQVQAVARHAVLEHLPAQVHLHVHLVR